MNNAIFDFHDTNYEKWEKYIKYSAHCDNFKQEERTIRYSDHLHDNSVLAHGAQKSSTEVLE